MPLKTRNGVSSRQSNYLLSNSSRESVNYFDTQIYINIILNLIVHRTVNHLWSLLGAFGHNYFCKKPIITESFHYWWPSNKLINVGSSNLSFIGWYIRPFLFFKNTKQNTTPSMSGRVHLGLPSYKAILKASSQRKYMLHYYIKPMMIVSESSVISCGSSNYHSIILHWVFLSLSMAVTHSYVVTHSSPSWIQQIRLFPVETSTTWSLLILEFILFSKSNI